jgi:LuxR family maltose regulon positive regulatory protein
LLAAPAGFGKTNLLIEWAEETNLPVAWLTLDSDDNDVGRFFRYLITALQTLEPGLGVDALDFIQSTRGERLDVGLTLLINEIAALPQEMAVALDDFHALQDPAVLQGLRFFLKHRPRNLHLIIATRSEPALELAFLHAKGQVVELGAADLRFTGEEVALLFRQFLGVSLPAETVQALAKRTDGWVTALQMAALSLRHEADPTALLADLQGDAHYLVDFLAEEVLDRQPKEIRQFLLRSATLDLLTGPLCEAVVNPEAQPGYGAVMLNRLEQAKLFIIALDEKREWFRYHHLFTDFLRHVQAKINPAEIPTLHKRAATWFEQNGHLDEACQHALASGDGQWAADLIERNIQTLIKTGQNVSLSRWIGKLPDALIRHWPRLGMAYAWGAIATYQLDRARHWLDEVQRSLEQLEAAAGIGERESGPGGVEDGELRNLRGGLAACESMLAILTGDMERGAAFARQATDYLQEEDPFLHCFLALDDGLYCFLAADTQKAMESLRQTVRMARQLNHLLVMTIASCLVAEVQARQGQLGQAWATLEKAQYMARGPAGEPLPLTSLVEIGFGDILLERNQLEEANAYLERGWRMTRSWWSLGSLYGLLALARLRLAQGDAVGSQAIIHEAWSMALSTESSRWDDALVAAVAVRLALLGDDRAAAERWWKKGGFPGVTATIALAEYPYYVFESLLLTQARFLLVRGQDTGNAQELQQALAVLKLPLAEAERYQRVTSQIEILVLQALVQFALQDGRAIDTLLKALALGEPEGFRRIYLDEGQRLIALLRQCRAAQQAAGGYLPSPAFVDSLLAALPSTDSGQPVDQPANERPAHQPTSDEADGLPISLSARELEVLALIAAGKSNQEIAAQLYLALNTVKRHAYNIYGKLEVTKRTQAVAKARRLGLVLLEEKNDDPPSR